MEELNTRDERAGRGKSTRRQTVLSGRKGSVHADFIEATGLVPTIKASTNEPVIATIAKGFNKFGTVDKVIELTEDISYPMLTPNATTFLGIDENKALKTSVLPPVYGNVFSSDRENKINASFNGNDGDTEFVDEYGNLFRAYGSGWQISNVNQYSGMNTLRCNSIAAGNRWECTPKSLDNRSLDQWTVEFFFRQDSFATSQTPFTASTGISAGIQVIIETSGIPLFFLSNNESSYNIWNGTPPILTTDVPTTKTGFGPLTSSFAMTATNWYHVAWVFDGLSHKVYINGYLVVAYILAANYSEVFNMNKPSKFDKITLGADRSAPANIQLIGNISNFAFHPYAKYITKKYPFASMTAASRDIFTPPSVPLSLTTQADRYYDESEAIYLDFESAADGDTITKDLYGRQLTAGGNENATLTGGSYIESGAAKFGTKSLYFSGTASTVNAAYIKAPIWADKWTVEFWARNEVAAATTYTFINLVVPVVVGGAGFQIGCGGNGATLQYFVRLGTTDSSADILSYDSALGYTTGVYRHLAVSYDGTTYRFFVDGALLTSVTSSLKVVGGSHFVFGKNAGNIYFAQGKIDDFAYVPYCKYTGTFTPPATALLSSMPKQYVFDTKKMQMYKGYPTSFTAENTLFMGEALTSINNVEDVITYALNGEYEERFGCDFIGTNGSYVIVRRHHIGVTNRFLSIEEYGIYLGGTTYPIKVGAKVQPIRAHDSGSYYSTHKICEIADRARYIIGLGAYNGPSLALGIPGNSIIIINAASAYYMDLVIAVKRSF